MFSQKVCAQHVGITKTEKVPATNAAMLVCSTAVFAANATKAKNSPKVNANSVARTALSQMNYVKLVTIKNIIAACAIAVAISESL